ncbi:MAG: hypothetical protein IKU55_03235 [Clostridia bacterium]|nr:hypothetical protein [Clostridia bacterium]
MNRNYDTFQLSIFLTTQELEHIFSDPQIAERELAILEKYLRVGKVYAEFFRERETDRKLLLTARDFFRARGIEVATGIMPVSGALASTGQGMCYADPKIAALYDDMLTFAAAEFDEIIVDDFFATDCTCDVCRAAKGDRTWDEYRMEMMTAFSRDHVIAPAKKANPNVKITLKYPTWHESFHWLGYDTEHQPHLFDEIYAGTETRHTSYSLFRNPRYTSYSLLRLLQHYPPYNTRGAWFDSIQCANSADIYMEQAELTLLAAPREMTLFNWSLCVDHTLESTAALGVRLEKLSKPLAALGEPTGVPVYLPFHSTGEDHVFDFLGMCGVPTDPVVIFPESGMVILTAASTKDNDLVEKIKAHVAKGGHVCMTSGCLAILQDKGISDCTAMRVTPRSQLGSEFGGFDFGWGDRTEYYHASHPINLPMIDWITNENTFLAMQMRDASPNILMAYSRYGKGRAYVLNIPDSYSDCYDIPAPVWAYLRKYLSTDLNVWLEGQTKIAVFPRKDQTVALRSFLEHGSIAKLHVKGDAETLIDLRTGGKIAPLYKKKDETVFELNVAPQALAMYRWE